MLPVDERDDVEAQAAGHPVESSEMVEPVVVQSDGTPPHLTVIVNRRDWVYAVRGITFTHVGMFALGQAAMLDLGFWCFLEAALLRPDEPEHLSNVAFHLNERGESADARTLLLRALSLDEKNTVVLDNLAYASAVLGDHESAIKYSLVALGQDQGVSFLLERLRYYGEAGGYDLVARMAAAGLEGRWSELPGPEVAGIFPVGLSEEGKAFVARSWDDGTHYRLGFAYAAASDEFHAMELEVAELRRLAYSYWPGGSNWSDCRASGTISGQSCSCLGRQVSMAYSYGLQAEGAYRRYAIYVDERALQLIGQLAAVGMDEIDGASVTPDDRRLLRTWWAREVLLHRAERQGILESIDLRAIPRFELTPGYVSLVECLRAESQAEDTYDAEYERSYLGFTDLFRSFSGNLSLPLGVVTVDVNGREGTVEATFGQGVQYTVGWNLKRRLPIAGIGWGVNLDNLVSAGAVVKVGPGGLTGDVDMGAAEPLPICHSGGCTSPRISIAKVLRFMN
jgi:hypothetical protein